LVEVARDNLHQFLLTLSILTVLLGTQSVTLGFLSQLFDTRVWLRVLIRRHILFILLDVGVVHVIVIVLSPKQDGEPMPVPPHPTPTVCHERGA
jgi:hypothetical protein